MSELNNLRRELIIIIIFSLLLLAAGNTIVIQRKPSESSPWMRMSPDALQYIAMAKGLEASPPFSHRILVPYLASLMPMPPDRALRLITYLCLSILYFTSMITLSRLQFSRQVKLISMLCLFASTGHLYLYSNPYLTDAFGMMALSLMLYALIVGNAILFAVPAVFGILARETTLFLIPAFLITRRWLAFIGIFCISAIAFAAPRFLIRGSESCHSFILPCSLTYCAEAYLAFGILWIPMILGLSICDQKAFPTLGASFASLLLGALISSVIAMDTIRMFAIMLPIGPLCWAYYFKELCRRSKKLAIGLVAFTLIGVPLALPTAFLPNMGYKIASWEDFYFQLKLPIMIFHSLGFVLAFTSAVILRHELKAGICAKSESIFAILQLCKTKSHWFSMRLSNKRS